MHQILRGALALPLIFSLVIPLAQASSADTLYGNKVALNKLVRDSQGRLRAGTLAEKTEIKHNDLQLTLAPNHEFQLYKNGKLRKAVIGENLSLPLFLGKIPIKEESVLAFLESGELNLRKCQFILEDKTKIQVPPYKLLLKKNSRLYFLSNDELDYSRSELFLEKVYYFQIDKLRIKGTVNSLVEFHANGNLKSVLLGEKVTIPAAQGSIPLDENMRLFFTPDNQIDFDRTTFVISENTALTIRNKNYTFKSGEPLRFYANATIKKGHVVEQIPLYFYGETIPVKGDTIVSFDPIGYVVPGKEDHELIADTEVTVGENRVTFKSKTPITFFENGRISHGTLATGALLSVYGKDIPLAKDSEIYFTDQGDVDVLKTKLVLDRKTKIEVAGNKLTLKEGTRLHMQLNGKLDFLKTTIHLADDGKIKFLDNTYMMKGDTIVEFYPDGALKEGTLGRAYTLNTGSKNIKFPPESKVNFDEDGNLEEVTLGDNVRIRDKNFDFLFKKKTDIMFTNEGELKKAYLAKGNILTVGKHSIPLPDGMEVLFSLQGFPVITRARIDQPTNLIISAREYTFDKGSELVFKSTKKIDLKESTLFLAKNDAFSIGSNKFKLADKAKVQFLKTGQIQTLHLQESQELKIGKLTLPFTGNKLVHFLKDGNVHPTETNFVLSEDMPINLEGNQLSLLKGTQLFFQENFLIDFEKVVFSIKMDQDIKAGKHTLPLVKDTVLKYHQDGALDLKRTQFIMSKNFRITLSSVEYEFGKGTAVEFHPNGEIVKASISDIFTLNLDNNKLTFKDTQTAFFLPNGQLNQKETHLRLDTDVILKVGPYSIPFKEKQHLRFHQNGRFYSGFINEDLIVKLAGQDLPLEKENLIFFDEKRNLDTKRTKVILSQDLNINVGANSIPFMKGSRIYFYDSGEVWQGVMAAQTSLKVFKYSIPFKKGKRLYFFKNGAVDTVQSEVYLVEDQSFPVGAKSFTFKEKKRINFYPKGQVKKGWISNQKSFVLSSGEFKVDTAQTVSFYDNGRVQALTLSDHAKINISGSDVWLSSGSEVQFHQNGAIKTIDLKENTQFRVKGNSVPLKQYTKVVFHSNGVLQEGNLSRYTNLNVGENRITLSKNEPIQFHATGLLKEGLLGSRAKILLNGRNLVLRRNTFVSFYSNGNVRTCDIEEPFKFNIRDNRVEIIPGSALTFYNNGQLKEGYTKFPFITYKKDQKIILDNRAIIGFFKSGSVKEGVLLKNSYGIGGGQKILFSEGSRIRFHSDGQVESGFPSESAQVILPGLPNQAVVLSPLKETVWDSRGRMIYGNSDDSFVFVTPSNERFTVHPGEWFYINHLKKGKPQIYPIDLNGRLKRDTPYALGGTKVTISKDSVVMFKGDDTIFTVISPSKPIMHKKFQVAPQKLEITKAQLLHNIEMVKDDKPYVD